MVDEERTHKHRNIIDDVFDLGLVIGGVVWYFVGIELDAETLAMVATAGATGRAALRRILMKLWGPQIEAIESRRADPPEPEVSTETSEEE